MPRIPDIRPLLERLRRRGGTWLVLWVGLLLGATFPYFESTRNANERPRLLQGMALVDEGSFAIDGPAARGLPAGPDVSRSRVDDRVYPNKPPGTSLVAAAAYRVARATESEDEPLTLRTYTWWARLLGGLLPALVLVGAAFRREAPRFGAAVAGSAVMLLVLGTPIASYAHLLYGHTLAAALLWGGVTWLVDAGVRSRPRGSAAARAAIGGVLAGAAVGVEYGAVFAALPIAVLLLFRVRRPQGALVLAAGLLGALLPVVLLAAYHDAVFGSPWSTGYHHVTNPEFAAKHGQGLLGLGTPSLGGLHTHLLSADGGLVWWAPTVLVALYGLGQLALAEGPRREEARVHLGVVLIYVLVVSSLSFEGGWRVGPRYLVIALPFLVMGWAHVLSQVRTHPLAMGMVLALGTYAIAVNALAANLWPHFDLTNIHQPVAEVLLPLWEHDRAPYDLVRRVTGLSGLDVAVYGSVIGTWVVLVRAAEGGIRMTLAILGGALLGLLLVYATRLVEPHPMGARNLAYIEKIWEPTEHGEGRSQILGPPSAAASGPTDGRRPGESSPRGSRPSVRHRGGSSRRP